MLRVRRAGTIALLFVLAGCAPPRATQFIGKDGSRDWWAIECHRDQAACWRQANAACHDSFAVHELRSGPEPDAGAQPLELTVHDGVPPGNAAIAGKVVVLTCAAPTIPPRAVAGPECASSPPRPNHCDEADGLTFTTGRTYLSPLAAKEAPAGVAEVKGPDEALAELRTVADGFDADVQAIADPIAAVDAIAKALKDFPSTYRMKPAQVKVWARASIAGKDVTLPADLQPDVAADLRSLLARVKAVDAAVRGTSELAAKLLEKIARRHARVRVLALAASAPSNATLANPGASVADRANADAKVTEIQDLQLEGRKKLDAIRTNVTNLSAGIMQAMAKLGDATS